MMYLSHSEKETEQLGERLGQALSPGTVVAYTGGLGMGKTAFTRGLARGLGCTERVTSDALPADTVYVRLRRSPTHENWREIDVEGAHAL